MKSIKIFSLLGLLLTFCNVTAQEFRLGKVSVAELEQKYHPTDTTAAAAILYKKGRSRIDYNQTDGFVLVTEVESRIKIYKKEGYNWADQSIGYYVGDVDSKEKIDISDAVTYNLVGGNIEKTKLKSDGIFDESVNKYRSRKKISMPNVKEGSVLEFKYTVRTDNIGMVREWTFQTSIPVNFSEYVTYVPEYYIFNVRQKGYIFPKVKLERNNKRISFTNKERTGGGWSNTQTSFSTETVNYLETQTTYTGENFPAMKEESYVNNIDNYTSSLEQELSMIKYPNSPVKTLSDDWNSVVKTIYDYNTFGPELNKTGYFEDDIKAVLTGLNTSDEKMLAILNYVKSTVKWNGNFWFDCENGVKKAYKDKIGNIGDINLMLTAMLRYAGLNANPVLTSTRSNGIAFFPNRTAFNYVIAAVETPTGFVLLDASDKYSIPNVLPLRTVNWHGRLIRKDGTSEEIDLMPKKVSNDIVFLEYAIEEDGKISGKTRRQCFDYNAMITRNNIDGIKEEQYLEKLENLNNKIEISEYTKANQKEILLPTVESYSFVGSNFCELIGGKIYVSPMLFLAQNENPFKQDVREYPVDFGFPFADKYNISIKIPDGFTVETLPAPAFITMENNLGTFKFNIAANGNALQMIVSHQINEAIVGVEQYNMLKEYYKGMLAKEAEKIVLKRI